MIDDYDNLSAVPIEVKSSKDYTIHSAERLREERRLSCEESLCFIQRPQDHD